MKDEIKRTIVKYKESLPKKIFQREVVIPTLKIDKAIVVVGPRRAGKSFLLYHKLKESLNPIFINFEDSLITGINKAQLNEVLDSAKELYGSEKFSFFLDEIQNVDGWENFVISLLNEHYPVFITGSNSKLLSKEIATSLRGKSMTYLLLPLSFREYLEFENIKIEKNWEYTNKKFEIIKKAEEYAKFGGFPEIILSESLEVKNKVINNYLDSVLYKDLVDRLKIKNIVLVQIILKYILNLFGNTFSISSLEHYLKSNKINYSLEDVYLILKSLEDVFFTCYVSQYQKSFKKTELSRSKVYLFDLGYIHFAAKEPEDYGRILENLVFIELFRREKEVENKKIFYFKSKNGKECDFIVKRNKKTIPIQVCYKLTIENKEREISGLVEAMEFFNEKEGVIITNNQEEDLKIGDKKINVKPIWKWLLEDG